MNRMYAVRWIFENLLQLRGEVVATDNCGRIYYLTKATKMNVTFYLNFKEDNHGSFTTGVCASKRPSADLRAF